MDKGKKAMNYRMSRVDRANYEQQVIEERRLKKKREAEEMKKKEMYEQDTFFRKLRRMKTKEEKQGKDWVQTEDEYYEFGLHNIPLMDHYNEKRSKITNDFKAGKISEEDWKTRVDKLYAEHDAKKREIEDAEDAELKRYMDAPTSDEDE